MPVFINSPDDIEACHTIPSFPNPTAGLVTFNTDNDLKGGLIKLFAVTGEMLISKNAISGNSITIDLSGRPAGVYFVELLCDGVVSRVKVVKD